MSQRVFFAAAAPADVLGAHLSWMKGIKHPSEVSLTFSGQIEAFTQSLGEDAMFVTTRAGDDLNTGGVWCVHLPKPDRRGWRWHLGQLRYGWQLARLARRFRADTALLDSGTTHYFAMTLFKLFGMTVVPIMHNARWAAGFEPSGRLFRVVKFLDDLFFRHVAAGVLCASPECARQLPSGTRIEQFRAQFERDYFQRITPATFSLPLKVVFVGRAEENKGLLDIATMARLVEERHPGLIEWHICGDGPALPAFREKAAGLQSVKIHGWTTPDQLQRIRSESHVSIVPTTPDFPEALAMTAVESILAGRPLVTNSVVPALELLGPACEAALPADAQSHAAAVVRLALDPVLWERRRSYCATVQEEFYDRRRGMTAALRRLLQPSDSDDPSGSVSDG